MAENADYVRVLAALRVALAALDLIDSTGCDEDGRIAERAWNEATALAQIDGSVSDD